MLEPIRKKKVIIILKETTILTDSVCASLNINFS